MPHINTSGAAKADQRWGRALGASKKLGQSRRCPQPLLNGDPRRVQGKDGTQFCGALLSDTHHKMCRGCWAQRRSG